MQVLESSSFLVVARWLEAGQVVESRHRTADHSLVLAGPLWAATYNLSLKCGHRGLGLQCGEIQLAATPARSPACRAHSAFCAPAVFRAPRAVRATLLPATGRVRLSWRRTQHGWRAPQRSLVVEEAGWAGAVLAR